MARTRIFARVTGPRQYLAYEMRLTTDTDVAMILPLPTRGNDEGALEFIDLSHYDQFFNDLERCFPRLRSADLGGFGGRSRGVQLAVHRVGAFDASFVPTLSDFTRLDPRFRLPEQVSQQLPYADFGFAVFKLRAGEARIHPMALSFKTSNASSVFFPTAHTHDGAVHASASFDHMLYTQDVTEPLHWQCGTILPSFTMNFGKELKFDRTKGLVDPRLTVSRRELKGSFPNEDTWLPVLAA